MINRRDFLNGVALSLGAHASQNLYAALNTDTALPYPPLLQGMRGNHPGSFENAHELAREGAYYDISKKNTEEDYDLVVIGAGISGLSAAFFYREHKPQARILILDNHDDFGGHAKRNEFNINGKTLITYGGSESFQSPDYYFSEQVLRLLQQLGVDYQELGQAYLLDLYAKHGMSRGVFFDKAHFGENKVVRAMPGTSPADPLAGHEELFNARSWQECIAEFPISEKARAGLLELHQQPRDYLAELSREDKRRLLQKISYYRFLQEKAGLDEEALRYFSNYSQEFYGYGIDSISAESALDSGYPGFSGIADITPDPEEYNALNDAYIHHFPDGNASIARLLVAKLIPQSFNREIKSMSDIINARIDYSKLDQSDSKVRLRLNSTAVNVSDTPDKLHIGYLRNKELHKISAKHLIFACNNRIIPDIFSNLPDQQQEDLKQNLKAPLLYAKIVLKNWRSFVDLGVYQCYAPCAPFCRVNLDNPVNIGGYRNGDNPDEPIILHMVHVPVKTDPQSQSDIREQFENARRELIKKSFRDIEEKIIIQLDGMLGEVNADASKLIHAITLNRWAHGYSYEANSLFDKEEESARIIKNAREHWQRRISIANSDSEWSPYMHAAIDAAYRAVNELEI